MSVLLLFHDIPAKAPVTQETTYQPIVAVIDDPIGVLYDINTAGAIGDPGITYNESGITYNEADTEYGGADPDSEVFKIIGYIDS